MHNWGGGGACGLVCTYTIYRLGDMNKTVALILLGDYGDDLHEKCVDASCIFTTSVWLHLCLLLLLCADFSSVFTLLFVFFSCVLTPPAMVYSSSAVSYSAVLY